MDYEWVFDFPIPSGFVRYRNLVYFYYKYEGLMEYENATQFLKEFGMDEKLAETYASMEVAFQTWVHGDGTQGYLGNYKQRLVTLEELKADVYKRQLSYYQRRVCDQKRSCFNKS